MVTSNTALSSPLPGLPGQAASRTPNVVGPILDYSNLSLANGMTAGYGDNDGNTYNPPLPLASTNGQPVNPYGGDPNWPINRVGVMRNTLFSLPGYQQYYLFFIYNPNQITASFATNPNNIPALYLYGDGTLSDGSNAAQTVFSGASSPGTLASVGNAQNVPNLISNQTISWSLVFDRTYDMMYGNGPGANPDDNRGVLKDTAALYNLMGTFETQGAVPISTPVQVVFGQTASGQIWGFTGYITNVQITYGIFRRNMIPSRAEVDLQMMATYVSPQIAPTVANGQFAPPGTPGGPPGPAGPPT